MRVGITSYLSAPNLINACKPQVGEVYRIHTILSEEEKNQMQASLIQYVRLAHKREKFKEVFDPETGKVSEDEEGKLRIEKVRDWPLLIAEDEVDKTLIRDKIELGAKTLAECLFPGLVVMAAKFAYSVYKNKQWYDELNQELSSFFTSANEYNSYHLDEESTRIQVGENYHRVIRYETKKLDKNYKNERSLNAFTRLERQFLETYKLLDNHQKELPDEFKFKNLFSSLGQNQELKRKTMEMLGDCTIKNGVIYSKNLQEFIPYIKRMLHFFPEMKSEVEKAQQSLPIHILSTFYQSASSSYVKSIKDSLEFENDNLRLDAFFKSNELKILHIVQSNTSLEATRVYETFKMVENCYRDDEYHGFFSLDRISYLGDSLFIGFLKKVKNKYLLVVECDSDEAKEFLKKLFSALEDNHNIKVILATEKGSDLSKFISEYVVNNASKCREENSEVKWNDLTPDSQRKLLDKTVVFQGKEVPLNTVVNGNDALIDPETIVELFQNKKIEIGKPLPSLGETEGYYIDRKLVKKVKVKKEVLKDDSLTDLFAISNINKEELSRIVGEEKVRNFSEEDPDRSSPIRFITLSENAGENFKNLCDGYSGHTIHLLERKNNGDLIWRKSHGKTLSGLRRYIENYESDLPDDAYSRNNTSIKMVNVNDISNFDERLIVVAAEPGMGKTTALTRLGAQRADDSKWLIRINLVEYKDKLEQEGFSDVVKFLHENNIVSNTLAKKLLESRLNNSGNIVFLLDGFDEITSKGQTNVVNLIKKLQETKVEKVLISTRLHLRNELEYTQSECVIQLINSSKKQQEAFLRGISDTEIRRVKQGLYLPSFEGRRVKINGKCVAITHGLSQALFLQSGKSFLSNLETSAEIYERIAQGKQISEREEREVFAFSKLLNNFEEQRDSATNSLPSSLIHTKGYKTLSDLSNYIAGIKGDFAIHLVTSNHVVAIYRTGNNYAYFDSNTAFISGLKRVDQLMEVLNKAVKFAGYKVEEKGFLVEHFDVDKANSQLSNEDKKVLAKEIKTERQLLAEQDEKFGPIKSMVNRVQLYDFGTKIHVEGSVPLLINADMNLSSKKFQDHLDKKEVSITARGYLDHLKGSKNAGEVIQATKLIPFIGSKREIEEAEQIRNPKRSLLEQLVKGTIKYPFSRVV
ncbi:NACHT domain-containing protein [Wolbachia endosymbiont of Oedothorax gibbosus]|uniref:NACHT domain-containing protein n=1 Tax=Wolbachia endosymbiont of Oedothorax gibbosus TaxID=931100 RepID=UPI0020246A1D|nr:hypothetical protein [Wolbachia endosymbiont of Oedothorax gibbosus]